MWNAYLLLHFLYPGTPFPYLVIPLWIIISFTRLPTEKSDLTVDALKLHNDLQVGPLDVSDRRGARMEEDDDLAFTEKTSGTFLSGLSDCSNLTFSKVQRYWESNSAPHKEVNKEFE